jgi:hypothetical protein
MDNGYHVFLLIQLAQLKGVIEKELEYDTVWEHGQKLYERFEKSAFNDLEQPEYECIVKFLDGELNQTFHLDVDVVEVNRYKYAVAAKSLAEAKERILMYLGENCPTSLETSMKNGIQGYDMESGFETLNVWDVTEQ